MAPQLPVDDPSRSHSFTERTAGYVWHSPLLRAALILTLVNHAAALIITAIGALSAAMAGLLGLLSLATWFFAVVLPLMNREVKASVGVLPVSYWSEVVEIFCRVVLAAQTLSYTAILVYTLT